MYKAVNNLKEQKGFTLIELLIVVAIIGILAAIAVPAYLGQREKAKVRAVEGSAKGAVSEALGVLDSYVAGDPFIMLDTSGSEVCYESDTASATGKTCLAMYNQAADTQYTAYSSGMSDIITAIIEHHEGKNELSPFGTGSLFQAAAGVGKVAIASNGARSINIAAYGNSTTDPIFSTTVFAR